MKCSHCATVTGDSYIFAVGEMFCSDVCYLRYWQSEMPNLGGRWITEEDIMRVSSLSGYARDQEYNRIIQFIMSNFGNTALMLHLNAEIATEQGALL